VSPVRCPVTPPEGPGDEVPRTLEFVHSRRCPRSLESTEDVRQQEANERSEGAAGAERGAGAPASDGVRGSRGTKSPGQERAQRVSRRPEPPPRLRAARRSFSAKAGAAFALKRFGATKAERGEGAASTPARIKRAHRGPRPASDGERGTKSPRILLTWTSAVRFIMLSCSGRSSSLKVRPLGSVSDEVFFSAGRPQELNRMVRAQEPC
jgi:hypothetical protein